jgi:hypothetical protein
MQDNEARDTKICLIQEDFRDAMVGGSGFVWANDQPEDHTPKVGRDLWHACPTCSRS